jgi:hypothetical protein
MCYFQGQTFSSGYQGRDGCVYEGCTFIASVSLGAGSKIINSTFQCRRNFFGNCNSAVSSVGPGSTMVGGTAAYVRFDSACTWSNVSQGAAATPPDCVDCPPRPVRGLSNYSGGDVIVAGGGQTNTKAYCERGCDGRATLVHPLHDGDVNVATHDGDRSM